MSTENIFDFSGRSSVFFRYFYDQKGIWSNLTRINGDRQIDHFFDAHQIDCTTFSYLIFYVGLILGDFISGNPSILAWICISLLIINILGDARRFGIRNGTFFLNQNYLCLMTRGTQVTRYVIGAPGSNREQFIHGTHKEILKLKNRQIHEDPAKVASGNMVLIDYGKIVSELNSNTNYMRIETADIIYRLEMKFRGKTYKHVHDNVCTYNNLLGRLILVC